MMKTLDDWKLEQEFEAALNEISATALGSGDVANFDRFAGPAGAFGSGTHRTSNSIATRLLPIIKTVLKMKTSQYKGDEKKALAATYVEMMETVTRAVSMVASEETGEGDKLSTNFSTSPLRKFMRNIRPNNQPIEEPGVSDEEV